MSPRDPDQENAALTPARLARAADGTAFSPVYDDIYHAAASGPGQAEHVFLRGNGLPERWAGRSRFVILENGFGAGLNFLATWRAWRDDPHRPARLDYIAAEKHPFSADDLAALHGAWPEFAPLAAELRAAWPCLAPGFHRLALAGESVALTLLLGDAQTQLHRLHACVDAFYLDGFDPRKNPAMWRAGIFQRMAELAAPDATLATWCVARGVRDALQAAGFTCEKRTGFAHKREMLAGRLSSRSPGSPKNDLAPSGGGSGVASRGRNTGSPGSPKNDLAPSEVGSGVASREQTLSGKRAATQAPSSAARHALVIGAGVAGCGIAERLAARGWMIDLIDARAGPAMEGSGNLAGIVRPLLSRDDNLASRLSRACFLHTPRAWAALDARGAHVRRRLDGVLHVARDAEHEALQRETVRRAQALGLPPDYARFVEADEAAALAGARTALGGWWFARGGWASPPSICQALLRAAGPAVNAHFGEAAQALTREGGLWQAWTRDGQRIAAAPVAILASGAQARTLAQAGTLPIRAIRGQVSHVPAGRIPDLRHALCCEGYLTPAVDGVHCLGATYARSAEVALSLAEHAENLERLRQMLPDSAFALTSEYLDGRVGFRAAAPDRLPLIGPLPDTQAPLPRGLEPDDVTAQDGLFGLLGLGSRGLVWAALAAEHLASQICGDPWPLEIELHRATHPARFALRQARRAESASRNAITD